jgi:hypothetical protein
MGLFDDLAMGLGLKDRDDDYYERTARTLGRTQGAEREAAYRQSNVFQNKPSRGGPAGLLSSAFGDRSSRSQYRDINDMFDGGGPMASGGRYQGGGLLSLLANLLIGGDMGERKPYEAQGQVKISSTTGEIPKSTRDAIGALRPMLRPDNFMTEAQKEQVVMGQPVGNGYPDMSMPAIQGYTTPPAPQPPAPMAQAATGLTIPSPAAPQGVPEMRSADGSEEAMRQRMRNAGYDPTGLGPLELQTFIEAMGL